MHNLDLHICVAVKIIVSLDTENEDVSMYVFERLGLWRMSVIQLLFSVP